MTAEQLAQLREEISNPSIGSKDHLRNLSLSLLDELESTKRDSARWFKAFEKAVSVGARYEERIAELEARTVTVKLPHQFKTSMYGTPLYEQCDILAMLADAGINLTEEG